MVSGQRVPQLRTLKPASQQDTIPAGQDSLRVSAPQGDIKSTIKYSARDSIMFEVDRKVVNLYGDAKISYGDLNLEAAYIQIDYETNTLLATPLPDSTGKDTGVPVFKDSGGTYSAKQIAYNYKTRKGRISEVVTQQGEGYIHAEVVKKNENDEFFGYHAQYTTCNLEHPHFFIGATKMKGIPNDKVMTGPFNLVVADIPTPLGFIFGLFPMPKNTRASGVIVPTFGESRAQGFYLSNGGYYFAWNDYIGTRLTGDIYSLGGYNISMDNTYRKRYSYSGNLGVSYRYFKNDEADIERSRTTNDLLNALPPTQRTIWINWSHSPEQKPGRGRFSASVNAGSTGHQRINYNSTSQYLSPTFNSNITYQKTIQNTPFSYTAKLSQGQTSGGVYNFVLPDLNFSMTPVSFFEVLTNNLPTGKWYEQFTIGYNVNAQNRLTNIRPATSNTFGVPITEGVARQDTISLSDFDQLWKNGRRSADHNFQLNLGSYKIARYFNFSPSVSYRESWTDQRYSFRFNPDSQKVDVDTTNFGRIYDYSANASLSTTIYGTAYIGGKRVEAIRHLIRPNISYSYRPDFGRESFGFYQNVQTAAFPAAGRDAFTLLPRVANAPGPGLQSRLNLNVSNNIEMKVRSKTDTTAANQFEKVSILDNLAFSTSYNFAADSIKLAPVSLVANTRLFKIFNVTFNSTFDPYKRDTLGRQVDDYVFDFSKLKLANLTNANFTIGASLNPEARQSSTSVPSNLPILNPDRDPLLPDYVDFKIPWTLSFDYTIGYFRTYGATAGTNINQTLSMNGSVNLTDKWKITYFAGYDFTNNNISNANLQIYRDLHCWEMSIGWIPFGFAQGYNITINAKSALLQDLRLTRNRSARNRF
ncbi:putative LPS assembly protein LptD [Pontibacter aydingkolensis]